MGVIVDNSYQYDNSCHTIFGGERDFIDRWAASLGGVEQVRADFFRVLDWPGYRTRMPEEVRSELLRDVGWWSNGSARSPEALVPLLHRLWL